MELPGIRFQGYAVCDNCLGQLLLFMRCTVGVVMLSCLKQMPSVVLVYRIVLLKIRCEDVSATFLSDALRVCEQPFVGLGNSWNTG